MFSEGFLHLQLKECPQASGLTGARGFPASSSQRCDVLFGPSLGAEYFPAAQQLKVAFGMQLEEPCVSGSELKHFIMVLCGFGGRLHVNPGEAVVPSQDGRGGNKQAAWRCRAQTVVVMDVEPKERFTRAGEHPAQAVRAWQTLGVRTCQL